MLGKAVKLAYGRTDTHSCVSSWNKEFIISISEECGYDPNRSEQIAALNMAGRLTEIFPFNEAEVFYQKLLEKCYLQSKMIINNVALDVYLIGKEGEFIKYKK